MLGPAGDEDSAVADDARDEACDRAADVTLRVDVGIVEHGMPVAADLAAPIRLAFHQYAGDAAGICGRNLGRSGDAEIGQNIHDTANVERVGHRPMRDAQSPAPVRAVAEHDDLVRLDLDT